MAQEGRYISVILPLRLEWEPCYRLPEGMEVRPGDRVRVLFAHREYTAVVEKTGIRPQTAPEKIQDILGTENRIPPVLPEEIRLWRAVSDYYLCSVGEVYKAAYPSLRRDQEEAGARQRERMERSLAALRLKMEKARREDTRERYRLETEALEARLSGTLTEVQRPDMDLTPAQELAAEQIRTAFRSGKTVLLDGVTGSGKTEIYLQLASETLRKGRNVLYLVPEIALSRQLEIRVGKVFPDVRIFHSGESAARRQETAERIRQGKGYIVLGTRSALLLPHNGLGLIIVDEEHDLSYKQDSPAPRYHARETAVMLGLIQGAHVLLGSATPSLESLYNAEKGRFIRVNLQERYHQGAEVAVEIVDTVAERRKRGMTGSLSRKLLSRIGSNLESGGQTLVLRARKAYAPMVQCTECGHVIKCPHCNVSLSLHRNPDRLICHYCGHTEPFVPSCPKCGMPLQPLGTGIQKVEEELRALFPSARIESLDSDTPDAQEADIIERFARREIDILVGTQIITKGFDFAHLHLVAVLQADSLLCVQDFRADEKAFQLLEQFRGRSGRRDEPGTLVIQTRNPDHPVFARLQGLQTTDILEERRLFGYPPFTRIIQLVLRDPYEKRVSFMAEELSRALRSRLAGGPAVIGPYAPAVDRVADRHIRHIRIMLPRDKMLLERKKAIAATVISFEKERKYAGFIAIDVDPA